MLLPFCVVKAGREVSGFEGVAEGFENGFGAEGGHAFVLGGVGALAFPAGDAGDAAVLECAGVG